MSSFEDRGMGSEIEHELRKMQSPFKGRGDWF
jgi:hypothetical protein